MSSLRAVTRPSRSARARFIAYLALTGCGVVFGCALSFGCAEGVNSTGGDDDDGAAVGSGGGGAGSGGFGAGGMAAASSSGSGGSSGVRAPLVGELVISEIMPNPAVVGDDVGEWVELSNVTGDMLSLDGCSLVDGNVPVDDEVAFGAGVVVAPGQSALVAKSQASAENGGLPPVVLAFGTAFSLANTGDEVILRCGTTVIDAVTYDAVAPLPFTSGAAAQLDAGSLSAQANDNPGNWCTATKAYGSGDIGTPGQPNAVCP